MRLYYLTEMNLLRLENTILKFIHNNHIEQRLTNGIIGKIAAMMYQKKIDYYYPDYLATTLNVDIKHVNTVYDHGKNGVLNVTNNNHLILKAFATAWKYRELYECEGNVDNIIRNLHTSSRQFYRCLDVAYMNPDKINEILSGKLKINVNDLFQIAQECCL